MNITVSNCTITCWIYPNGSQNSFEGLVYERDNTTNANGINYYNSGTGIVYTWANAPATYDWSSDLIIPTNTWSFLALVITPSNAVGYVFNTNGLIVDTNAVTNPPVTFGGGFAIGADPQAGTLPARIFNGEMDEVAVFATALSSNQLSHMYSSAGFIVAPPSPPTLSIGQSGTNIVIQWSAGKLFSTTNVAGPWTTVSNAGAPATSPYTTNALPRSQEFYKAGIPYTP